MIGGRSSANVHPNKVESTTLHYHHTIPLQRHQEVIASTQQEQIVFATQISPPYSRGPKNGSPNLYTTSLQIEFDLQEHGHIMFFLGRRDVTAQGARRILLTRISLLIPVDSLGASEISLAT